jgi:hypothetical protein
MRGHYQPTFFDFYVQCDIFTTDTLKSDNETPAIKRKAIKEMGRL